MFTLDYIDELILLSKKIDEESRKRRARKSLSELEMKINLINEFRNEPGVADRWIDELFPKKEHKTPEWLANMT